MKAIYGTPGAIILLALAGCNNVEPGPVHTSYENIQATGGETAVRADIRMGAGELHITGGAPNVMTGKFQYSENVHQPIVRYDVTGDHGRLTVESEKNSSTSGKTTNTWDLQLTSGLTLDMTVNLGAGESTLDLSYLQVRSVEVNMGAGEMTLNMAGKYRGDITAHVNGGVGEAKIRLPRDMGVEVKATGGLGSIDAKGLTKRDGKYYNDAYADDKPAIRMEVQGGIGNIDLSVE